MMNHEALFGYLWSFNFQNISTIDLTGTSPTKRLPCFPNEGAKQTSIVIFFKKNSCASAEMSADFAGPSNHPSCVINPARDDRDLEQELEFSRDAIDNMALFDLQPL